jgi:hypothetical protein
MTRRPFPASARDRLTFANVTSLLALVVALSGTATAAVLITGRDVKDGSLTGRDIHNGSIGGVDVRDRSLLATDFKLGQLPAGPRGPSGPKGDNGLPGPQGNAGSPGAAGATNVVIRIGAASAAPNGTGAYFSSAACLPGERATGGGYTLTGAGSDDVITINRPSSSTSGGTLDQETGRTPTQWNVQANDVALDGGGTLKAWVVCASP